MDKTCPRSTGGGGGGGRLSESDRASDFVKQETACLISERAGAVYARGGVLGGPRPDLPQRGHLQCPGLARLRLVAPRLARSRRRRRPRSPRPLAFVRRALCAPAASFTAACPAAAVAAALALTRRGVPRPRVQGAGAARARDSSRARSGKGSKHRLGRGRGRGAGGRGARAGGARAAECADHRLARHWQKPPRCGGRARPHDLYKYANP